MGQILLTLCFHVSFTDVLWYLGQGLNFTDEETKVEKGKAPLPRGVKDPDDKNAELLWSYQLP